MTLTQTVWLNIFCSLLASLCFLFIVLALFKPRIKISEFICRSKVEFDDENIYHIFKIVNQSYFSAFDLRIELYELKKYSTPPNAQINTRYLPLSLVLSTISDIRPRRPKWIRKSALHVVRIRTMEDLNTMLKDPNISIELKISLRHGLTGLTSVYRMEYCDSSEVKGGKFTYGPKIDFIPFS